MDSNNKDLKYSDYGNFEKKVIRTKIIFQKTPQEESPSTSQMANSVQKDSFIQKNGSAQNSSSLQNGSSAWEKTSAQDSRTFQNFSFNEMGQFEALSVKNTSENPLISSKGKNKKKNRKKYSEKSSLEKKTLRSKKNNKSFNNKSLENNTSENKALEKKPLEKKVLEEKSLEKKSLEKNSLKNERKENKHLENKHSQKVKRPIGVRLILIISLLVLFSMGLITILVSYFISKDTRINAEDNNLTINSRTAADCQSRINAVISSVGMLYDMILSDEGENRFAQISSMFFDRNKSVEAVSFILKNQTFCNRQYFLSNELETESFNSYILQESESCDKAMQGLVKIQNASPFFGNQLLAIFTPVFYGSKGDVAVILFSSEELSESFANSSINSSIFVNDEGIVLVHTDIDKVLQAEDLSENLLVHTMLESRNNNEQFMYTDENGTEFIAAFRKIGINPKFINEYKKYFYQCSSLFI